ncbi:ferritin-like domain-containing protein [Haloferula sp.]|uniref:ferritin-like domain-containing protein n=1 Tax=Haloferula sp. TaxID=2497595 RepID=UPI0032A0B48A
MTLKNPQLARALQTAYSAERAASYAYIGHAGSLKKPDEVEAVQRIEQDEWDHRREVLAIMKEYEVPVSRWLEWKFWWIGRVIGLSCYVIGRFMPYFFAGKLESGNVCEYFVMLKQFRTLGITKHDKVLYEMGVREKEHEIFFLEIVQDEPWLRYFERVFNWGVEESANDVDLEDLLGVDRASDYCKKFRSGVR